MKPNEPNKPDLPAPPAAQREKNIIFDALIVSPGREKKHGCSEKGPRTAGLRAGQKTSKYDNTQRTQ